MGFSRRSQQTIVAGVYGELLAEPGRVKVARLLQAKSAPNIYQPFIIHQAEISTHHLKFLYSTRRLMTPSKRKQNSKERICLP